MVLTSCMNLQIPDMKLFGHLSIFRIFTQYLNPVYIYVGKQIITIKLYTQNIMYIYLVFNQIRTL